MADNKGDDGLLLFLFLLAVMWGGGWLLWKGFRPQITEGIVAVRAAEMKLASLWWDDDDTLQVPLQKEVSKSHQLHAQLGDMRTTLYQTNFGIWRKFANTATVQEIQPDHLKVMSYVALYALRWPIAAIFTALFFWTIFNGPTSKFRRIMGLEALMVDQAKTFRVITPFLKFNPNKLPNRPPGSPVPADLPIFAEALGPEEWIAVNEIPMPDGNLDRAAAEAAFARQLGPRWKGWQDLPTELQIILAAFCLKASRQRNDSLPGCYC